MSNLSNKILSYSPEQYIRFNTAYSTTPTNLGSGGTGTWTLSGEAPTLNATSGPDGEGSWELNWGGNNDTSTTRYQISTSSANVFLDPEISDGDLSVGVWFKFPTIPTTVTSMTTPVQLLSVNTEGALMQTLMHVENNANKGKLRYYTVNAAVKYTTNRYDDGQWHYLAYRMKWTTAGTIDTHEIYIDGQLLDAGIPRTYSTSISSGVIFGQLSQTSTSDILPRFELSNFYVAPFNTITATEIAEIWAARVSAVNGGYTAQAMEATNAHFPEPIIETAIGASIGSEPMTASAEQLEILVVSGNVNYTADFALANALMTEPTLAFTSDDHTEIVTSIIVSAEFINASVSAEINITINADPLNSTTGEFGAHTVIAGISISYAAMEMAASSQMVEPFFYGSPDRLVSALPMTASNAVFGGQFKETYESLVKKLNPSLFMIDPTGINYGSTIPGFDGLATPVNKGFDNWGTGNAEGGALVRNSPFPWSSIGNGNSYSTAFANSGESAKSFGFADSNAVAQSSYFINAGTTYQNDFSFEYWINHNEINTQQYALFTFRTNTTRVFNTTSELTLYKIGSEVANDGILDSDQETFTVNHSFTPGEWHHVVITGEYIKGQEEGNLQLKAYVNGNLIGSNIGTLFNPNTTGLGIQFFPSGYIDAYLNGIAFYKSVLSPTDVTNHYQFVAQISSPNRTIYPEPLEASAEFANATIFAAVNTNIPGDVVTASTQFVNPAISAETNVDNTFTATTASSEMIEPFFYGDPDTSFTANAMTAYAETSQNNFALDGTYYAYVQTNIAPFRYVTFDNSANQLLDYGTDNDFSVPSTLVNGSYTSPAFGINNTSAKTSGAAYTEGVILLESEWNDDWGTSTNLYHGSFWIEQAPDDTSTDGVRVLWNLNGYYDNQHVVLYHYQNKLHLQLKNSTTFHEFDSPDPVTIFDMNRHHIVLEFDHTGANNYVRVYVDGAIKITANIGSSVPVTVNGVSAVGPNDPANNHPRMSVGCLITPFGVTSLPQTPVNTKLYVDEVHWAVTGLNATQVLALYNAMPAKTSSEFMADFFLAQNATLVMPSVGAGTTFTANFATASAQMVEPTLYLEFNNTINMNTIEVSADSGNHTAYADNITNININAEFMFASSLMNEITGVESTIPGQTMTAIVRMPMSTPYFDPYHLLIKQQVQLLPSSAYYGYSTGDIDSL